MQHYSTKLRLSGSTMNEVRDVFSAPEILVLQYIHGVDAVTELKKVKNESINNRDFRDMLKSKYDPALMKRDKSIDIIFGALNSLPAKLPEDLLEMHGIVDEDDIIAVAKSVTKTEKNNASHDVPKTIKELNNIDKLVPRNEVDMKTILE